MRCGSSRARSASSSAASGLDPARHPVEVGAAGPGRHLRLRRALAARRDARDRRPPGGGQAGAWTSWPGSGRCSATSTTRRSRRSGSTSRPRSSSPGGAIAELTTTILTADEVRDLVERMLRTSGRRVDLSSPFVDATLPDGSRLHVVIPDITRDHWHVNIRKFVVRADHLDDLVRLGTLTAAGGALPRGGRRRRASTSSSPAARRPARRPCSTAWPRRSRRGSGSSPARRSSSSRSRLRDVASMQCRQPSLEGTGEVPLRRLVKEALRMRPSRIIVGEVRQAESLDLLIALNSGVPGMCTIHANSAREAIMKMCTLPLLAGENVGVAVRRADRRGGGRPRRPPGPRARRGPRGCARSSPCPVGSRATSSRSPTSSSAGRRPAPADGFPPAPRAVRARRATTSPPCSPQEGADARRRSSA